MPEAPLYGLVLAGGRSTRMGRDKAALEFGGASALARACALIGACCERSFVSVSSAQRDDPLRAGFPCIEDQHGSVGPADGILSAQFAHPHAAWLVVACDLPLLDTATLNALVGQRETSKAVTAFRSTHDGLPEPLCAIYEPASCAQLEGFFAAGMLCPRKMLMRLDVCLLEQPSHGALDNINAPVDLQRMRSRSTGSLKTLDVEYFALFRERTGVTRETVRLGAGSPAELFAMLSERHAGLVPLRNMKVAVNDEMASLTTRLSDGDRVLFFPPVSGG